MENVIETIVKNIETGGEFTGVLTKPSDLRDREEKIDDYAYQYAKSLWLEKHGKLPENGTDEMNDFFEFQKSLRCKFELYENGVKLPAVTAAQFAEYDAEADEKVRAMMQRHPGKSSDEITADLKKQFENYRKNKKKNTCE